MPVLRGKSEPEKNLILKSLRFGVVAAVIGVSLIMVLERVSPDTQNVGGGSDHKEAVKTDVVPVKPFDAKEYLHNYCADLLHGHPTTPDTIAGIQKEVEDIGMCTTHEKQEQWDHDDQVKKDEYKARVDIMMADKATSESEKRAIQHCVKFHNEPFTIDTDIDRWSKESDRCGKLGL
jgi:hypothetical protein